MSEDLIAFLKARLDEDQAAAETAAPGPWRFGDWSASYGTTEQARTVIERSPEHGRFPAVRQRDAEADLVLHLDEGWDDEEAERNAEHILRHDPARVLADIAAKRAIIDAYELIATKEQENAEEAVRHSRRGPGWSDPQWAQTMTNLRTHGWERGGQLTAANHMVRCLALAYADHPDYKEAWRP